MVDEIYVIWSMGDDEMERYGICGVLVSIVERKEQRKKISEVEYWFLSWKGRNREKKKWSELARLLGLWYHDKIGKYVSLIFSFTFR